MASLMSDNMSDYTSEVVLLDEEYLMEPQEKSEEPVSPPRTAFMPITKPIPLRPPPSSSSLSNAAGGTFNPSSHHGSPQPLSTLQSPLFSNPHFKSQVPQFLGPAPHTSRISPGFPPCWDYQNEQSFLWKTGSRALGVNMNQWHFRWRILLMWHNRFADGVWWLIQMWMVYSSAQNSDEAWHYQYFIVHLSYDINKKKTVLGLTCTKQVLWHTGWFFNWFRP